MKADTKVISVNKYPISAAHTVGDVDVTLKAVSAAFDALQSDAASGAVALAS